MGIAVAGVILAVLFTAGLRLLKQRNWWAIVPAALAVGWMAGICVLAQP